jgi:DNA-binding YbaB/EbfC family protein
MSWFEKLGQFGGMLRNLPKLKEELEKTQQRLGQLTVEGDAGAGMVKVRVSGRIEVLSCSLSEEAMKLNDREMLEDLIRAATNQAIEKARKLAAEEMSKTMTGMGLPAGMNIPGVNPS